MLTREQAQSIAGKVLAASRFPECTVRISASEELNTRFANNGVTTSGFVDKRAVAIESTRDGQTGSSWTDQTDEDSLRAAVRRSEEIAALTPADPEHMPPLGKQDYPVIDHFDEATATARGPELVPQIRAILDRAAKEKLVAAGYFERTAGSSAIANKNGLFGYTRFTDCDLSTTFRSADGKSSGWADASSVRLSAIDGAQLADRAAMKCLRWRNPSRLDPGRYTVVLEPAAVGGLLEFVDFDARSSAHGHTFLSRKGGGTLDGEKLFPESVTLRTDPFDPRLPAPCWSVAGGDIPARKMNWVEKGTVRALAYSRYWAAQTKHEPTPGAEWLVMEGGDASLDDLIGSVDRGLLVTRFWYIRMLNPRTMQLTGLTRDGLFLIEEGHIARPVVNFRFNESPVRVLANVRKLARPERAGTLIVPPLVASDFDFASVSDAV